MRSINEVRLQGNIGKLDARVMPNGNEVVNFTLATNSRWKDEQQQVHEDTEWHRCVAFGNHAKVVREHAAVGHAIHVTGSLKTRTWQDDNNIQRYITEIVVNDIYLLPQPVKSNANNAGMAPAPANC